MNLFIRNKMQIKIIFKQEFYCTSCVLNGFLKFSLQSYGCAIKRNILCGTTVVTSHMIYRSYIKFFIIQSECGKIWMKNGLFQH